MSVEGFSTARYQDHDHVSKDCGGTQGRLVVRFSAAREALYMPMPMLIIASATSHAPTQIGSQTLQMTAGRQPRNECLTKARAKARL